MQEQKRQLRDWILPSSTIMYCGGVKNVNVVFMWQRKIGRKLSTGKVKSMSEAEGEKKDEDLGDVAAMVDEVRRSAVATRTTHSRGYCEVRGAA
jgi:hypothetical protein